MKKKVIPMLIAIVLILIVIAVAFGSMVIDKYSYSKEFADMEAYFGLEQREMLQSFCRMRYLVRKQN